MHDPHLPVTESYQMENPAQTGFQERMKQMIKESGGTYKMADLVGCSEGVIRKWRDGQSEPTMRYLKKLSEVTLHSAEWIVNGRSNEDKVLHSIMEPIENYLINEFSIIRRYEVEASTGNGIVPASEDEIEGIAFKKEWLKRRGLYPNKLMVITARGDSMAPTIKNGALLLVDLNQKTRLSDGIYVIQVDGALMAKRLQVDIAHGGLLIRSDNPAYAEIKVLQSEMSGVTLVGRVVWAGAEL